MKLIHDLIAEARRRTPPGRLPNLLIESALSWYPTEIVDIVSSAVSTSGCQSCGGSGTAGPLVTCRPCGGSGAT